MLVEKRFVAEALLLIGEITASASRSSLPEFSQSSPPDITVHARVTSNVAGDSFSALTLPRRPGAQFGNQPMLPPESPGASAVESNEMRKPQGGHLQPIAFQDPNATQTNTPQPLEALTDAQLKQVLKEKMREYVFKMVNLYWKEHDLKTYGYWDQDGDGLADRLDQDSYNGHGVGKAYPKPIPGARADGHYNCEYFAQNFWLAYRDLFYDTNPNSQCWKLEYDGHATIAFYFEHKGESIYVFLEPQGGSSWFISLPRLPLNEMPARGSSKTVRGIHCHNLEENSWTGVQRFPGSKPLPEAILDHLVDKKPIRADRPVKPEESSGSPRK